MTLRYDATGLKPSVIGDARGVSDIDRSRLGTRLIQAHQSIRAAHERGALGFIDAPLQDCEQVGRWAAQKRGEGFRDQVVIGIGGSSLGTRALYEALAENPDSEGAAHGLGTFFFVYIEPVGVACLFGSLDLLRVVFLLCDTYCMYLT